MGTGRTVARWLRAYVDGFDMSGYAVSVGPLAMEWEAEPMHAFSDEVQNTLVGQPEISCGELNGFFDNTNTSGMHAVMNSAGAARVLTLAFGIRAAPAAGDPTFNGTFTQLSYEAVPDKGFVTANMKFGKQITTASEIAYGKSWGVLLHPKGAETAVNTATGVDDRGASSAAGGYFVYHIMTANGTATVRVQDASTNTNPSFADLSGATSGVVDASSTPKFGIVALSTTATVRQFLRWQITFGTATSVTFLASFVRG